MKSKNRLVHLLWLALACGQGASWAESPATTLSTISTQPTDAEISAARVFDEPLVPLSAETNARENQALAAALTAYSGRVVPDDCSSLANFADHFPQSRWTASLLLHLGVEYYNYGYFSKALDAWQRAWTLFRANDYPPAKPQADRALGELTRMYARIGRTGELSVLLDSTKDRDVGGPGSQLVHSSAEAAWVMMNKPDYAFGCGPAALDRILLHYSPSRAGNPVLLDCKSGTNGFSLNQVADISQKLGMNYQMAYRQPGAPLIVPSVVHWKVDHYAALTERRDGRVLVQDYTFVASLWVSEQALNEESSGYFLVPPGDLPAGWRPISEEEAQTVWGRGQTETRDQKANCKCRDKSAGGTSCKTCKPCAQGMTTYTMHALLTSLSLEDTPVIFDSPVGPSVGFTATYNQTEADQPANFYYSNLGPKWDCNWVSYITDNPTSPNADVSLYADGGGELDFHNFNPATQSFAPEAMTQAVLVRLTTNSYELQYSDGSRQEFKRSDGSTGSTRRVFLTQNIDPWGNAVQYNYDSLLRITNIVNAIGQAMTVGYTNSSYPFLITSVSDPFGRTAQLLYDTNGLLVQITDALGMISHYTYGANQFITNLTTPYGTTTFTTGTTNGGTYLTATDPLGGTEALEYSQSLPVPHALPASDVPHGLSTFNLFIDARDSFFWDKKAFAEGGWDWTKAHIYHWLHQSPNGNASARILESEKDPLESRIWYNYPGESTNFGAPYYLDAAYTGSSASPSVVARVLDDGTTQLRSFGYNAIGNVTNTTDSLGRSFTSVYATNNVDLIGMYMTSNGKHELLGSMTYNPQHLATSITDASGQTTTNTYNARGQIQTITDTKNETTTFGYDANGFLISVQGPLAGPNDTATFTYDAANRVHTSTDTEGYTITYSYDAFDRPVLISYPDGTSEQFVFDRLDLAAFKDRLNRWTTNTFNANRQLVSTLDPLGRLTRFEYCTCGLLEGIIDPLGRKTTFTYDIQSRLISKRYADGSVETQTYENASGRPSVATDTGGHQTIFEYNADDTPKRISYLGSTNATPAVTFTYDTNYNRLAAMQDGIGTTVYAYNPITPTPALGAGRLQSVSGPLPNSTVSYQYDELGRVISAAVNGAVQSVVYDVLGRPAVKTNRLGTFRYTYRNATAVLTAIAYPNGQTNLYSYYDIAGDQRLKQVLNLKPNGSLLSGFGYAYNAVGQITQWTNGWDTLPTRVWTFTYDAADQLAGATASGGPTPSGTNTYAYDSAGNRTQASTGAVTNTFSFNSLNQLAGGDTGLTNALTYEWDAANRLVAIDQGTHRTEFSYDGLGRRTRIVEKDNGSVVADNHFLWCGNALCEVRDSSGGTVVRRLFDQGESLVGSGTTNLFYTRDHLGSVREMLDSAGNLHARYDYDLYGQQTVLAETATASFGFTGHFQHRPSGLDLTLLRAYDPRLGRWLSRDPLGERAGLNLYAYVGNEPINRFDPFGDRDRLDDFLEGGNNLVGGVWDAVTFDQGSKLTAWIWGAEYAPCKNSAAYKVGWYGTTAVQLAAGGVGIYKTAGKVLAKRGAAVAIKAGAAEAGAGVANWIEAGEGASWVAEAGEGTSWVAEAGEGASWLAEGESAARAGTDTVRMTAAEYQQMMALETAAREAAATPAMRYMAAQRAFDLWMRTAPAACKTAQNQYRMWKQLAAAFGFRVP